MSKSTITSSITIRQVDLLCLYTNADETIPMGMEGMSIRKTNIHTADYEEDGPSERDPGTTGRQLDLSGEHLGVKLAQKRRRCVLP